MAATVILHELINYSSRFRVSKASPFFELTKQKPGILVMLTPLLLLEQLNAKSEMKGRYIWTSDQCGWTPFTDRGDRERKRGDKAHALHIK